MKRRNFLWRTFSVSVWMALVMIFTAPNAYSGTIQLPKTGQTTSYYTGDDGNLQKGVEWPTPRFTDNGDGTITDELTGLMWLQDANCAQTSGYDSVTTTWSGVWPSAFCSQTGGSDSDGAMIWEDALNFVYKINLDQVPNISNCGYTAGTYTDWRMPNIHELESLVNSGYMEQDCSAGACTGSKPCATLAEWLECKAFTNIGTGQHRVRGGNKSNNVDAFAYRAYWASTIYMSYFDEASWAIQMEDGGYRFADSEKACARSNVSLYVWPVRCANEVSDADGTYCSGGEVKLPRTGMDDEGGSVGDSNPKALYRYCSTIGGAPVVCSTLSGYEATQDGNLKKGIAWPTTGNTPTRRFTDNGDGTMTDELTGLMWLQDANCAQTIGYDPDTTGNGYVSWQNALNFIAGINAGTYSSCSAGYDDWRLPNRLEQRSLTKWYGEPTAYTGNYNYLEEWLKNIVNGYGGIDGEGFLNVDNSNSFSGDWWTSTSFSTDKAWDWGASRGWVRNFTSKTTGNKKVWPVRSVADPPFNLTVKIEPAGAGNVTDDAGKIDCPDGGDCFESYMVITTVVLTADDTDFKDWTGCDSAVVNVCTMTMDMTKPVTANFNVPDIAVNPMTTAFGNVNIGLSPERTIAVTNDGLKDLIIGTVADPSSPFGIVDKSACEGQTLAPSASCDITVRFSPTTAGLFYRTFNISSDDPDENPITVALTGTGTSATGPDIAVTPSNDVSGNFMNTTVGDTPQETITVTNEGTADLIVSAIVLTGGDAAMFSVATGTCPSLTPTILSGGSCTIIATFSPTSTGLKGTTLRINSNDPDESLVNVNLSGSAIATGNNPPSKPILTYPANGATNLSRIRFKWDPAIDNDLGDIVAHRLYYGTDPSFAGATVVGAVDLDNRDVDNDSGVMYAMVFGNPIGIIALFGVIAMGMFLKRKKIGFLIVTVIFAGGLLLSSCGGGAGGGGVTKVQAGATYYWKVVADDGQGGSSESDTWSFTTAGQ